MPCRERRYRDIREVMVGGVRVLRQIWVGADGNAIVTFDVDIERLPAAVNMLFEPLKVRDLAPGRRGGR